MTGSSTVRVNTGLTVSQDYLTSGLLTALLNKRKHFCLIMLPDNHRESRC